jgi:hypothetical protein
MDGFTFAIENLGDDGRRGDLTVDTPFGRPQLGAKVELARHALSRQKRSRGARRIVPAMLCKNLRPTVRWCGCLRVYEDGRV